MAKDSKKKQKKKEGPKPATILLVRHGENDLTETHKLAGRTPGVHLNAYGQQQAEALGKRLANRELHAIYASPLERTVETAQAIVQHHKNLTLKTDPRLLEADYGVWTGKKIKDLAKTDMWPVVQYFPSGAGFPEGETMYEMQARFISAINSLAGKHPGETIVIVGHADLIKGAIAHYLGVHFDLFQRIVVSTASITVISLGKMGPRVVTVNDTTHNPSRPEKSSK